MYYEFGVMSKKWSIEATTEEVAKIAMTLFIGKNIPVAIYKPESNAFLPMDILNGLDMTEETIKNVKKAMDNIKELL